MADYIGPAEKCARCGKRATGWAKIGADRFCHGDGEPDPTCYMLAQRSEFFESPYEDGLWRVAFHSRPEGDAR